MKKFEIGDALRSSWEIVKENLVFLIVISILLLLVNYLPGFLSGAFFESDLGAVGVALQIIGVILSIVTSIGAMKITLNLVDKKKSEYSDLFNYYPLFFPYLGVSIVMGILVMLGFIALVIPGIYLAVRLQFSTYVLVDRRLGVLDSVKESWRITQGHFWKLFLFGIVIGLLNLVGFLLLGIGLLVTIPLTLIAVAYVYRKLEGKFSKKQ